MTEVVITDELFAAGAAVASAFRAYGGTHKEDCDPGADGPCTCGLWDALRQADDYARTVDAIREANAIAALEPLPSVAKARRTDPQTSVMAADSIDNMAERHRGVLAVAESLFEPFTYDFLVWVYTARQEDGWKPADRYLLDELPAHKSSSIRSRCAELRRAGWIEPAGKGVSDAGRSCVTWRAVR